MKKGLIAAQLRTVFHTKKWEWFLFISPKSSPALTHLRQFSVWKLGNISLLCLFKGTVLCDGFGVDMNGEWIDRKLNKGRGKFFKFLRCFLVFLKDTFFRGYLKLQWVDWILRTACIHCSIGQVKSFLKLQALASYWVKSKRDRKLYANFTEKL